MMGDTAWQKASKSGPQRDCVEMRRHRGLIQIRDSKNPDGTVLNLAASDVASWLDAARRGEFDQLAAPPA